MQITTLPGGLRIVTEFLPHVKSVSVGVFVYFGVDAETKENSGVAHFLEHIFFKGSTHRTGREIVEAADGVGAELNAYTTKEYACYFVRTRDAHLDFSMEVLGDMLRSPAIKAEDVDRERSVILDEISSSLDDPEDLVNEMTAQALWPDHPLGRPVLGTIDTVSRLEAKDLRSFYDRMYVGPHMVVAATGNVKHEQMVELVSKTMGDWGGTPPELTGTPFLPAVRAVRAEKPGEQVHICLGFPAFGVTDPRYVDVQLLAAILGGGMSSRLFQSLREQKGLVYDVAAYQSPYRQSASFTTYVAVAPSKAKKALAAMVEVLESSVQDLSATEVDRVREQFKSGVVFGLESPGSHMSRLGRELLLEGRVRPIEELLERVDAATSESLSRLAGEVLASERAVLAAVGPIDERLWSDLQNVLNRD